MGIARSLSIAMHSSMNNNTISLLQITTIVKIKGIQKRSPEIR